MLNSVDSPSILQTKQELADRLRQVRLMLHGEQGGPDLAQLLGIPARSWSNYENGVTIPGEVLLVFLVLTNAEPLWLFRGEGLRFRPPYEQKNSQIIVEAAASPVQISELKL